MSTPNPFGLDQMMQKYQPTQLGAGVTIGNPQAQQQYAQQNLAQMMEAYRQAQAQQERGQQMMTPEYIQNSGGLGALAMIAQAYVGKKIKKRADESASDYARRIADEKMRQDIEAQKAAAAAEEAKWNRKVAHEKDLAQTKANQPTTAIRTLQALQADPSLAASDIARKRAAATSVNVSGPATKPFAKGAYEDMKKYEGGARAAQETLAGVQELKSLLDDMEGGRYEQAVSYIQEYAPALFPKDATNKVAIRQAFAGTTRPMIQQSLEMMRGLGQMTEKEFNQAIAAVPSFGIDKSATQYLSNLFERKANSAIDTYESALEFSKTPEFEQSGFLRFRPAYTLPAEKVSTPNVRTWNPETRRLE